jgi:hypothetical protein
MQQPRGHAVLLAATLAALLIASPSQSDADHIAADGGFLLGNAHRCGIASERIVRAGRLIRGLVAAAANGDGKAADSANTRFSEFFLISAVTDPQKDKLVPSCGIVENEFARLEQHQIKNAGAGE